MDTEKFYIPRHLDDPNRLLFWTVDEVLSFFVPMVIGMIINHPFVGVVLALVSFRSWKKLKTKLGRNLIKRFIYWYYPKSFLGLKLTPDSSIRHYIN